MCSKCMDSFDGGAEELLASFFNVSSFLLFWLWKDLPILSKTITPLWCWLRYLCAYWHVSKECGFGIIWNFKENLTWKNCYTCVTRTAVEMRSIPVCFFVVWFLPCALQHNLSAKRWFAFVTALVVQIYHTWTSGLLPIVLRWHFPRIDKMHLSERVTHLDFPRKKTERNIYFHSVSVVTHFVSAAFLFSQHATRSVLSLYLICRCYSNRITQQLWSWRETLPRRRYDQTFFQNRKKLLQNVFCSSKEAAMKSEWRVQQWNRTLFPDRIFRMHRLQLTWSCTKNTSMHTDDAGLSILATVAKGNPPSGVSFFTFTFLALWTMYLWFPGFSS